MQETLLLVDDQQENLYLLSKILHSEGYKTVGVQSGPEALKLLSEQPFDMVLLDVMMPDMNGFEVCAEIRSDPAKRNLPVIFITAKADPESVSLGLSTGGDDYVAKPFHLKELLARVHNHLEHRRIQKELERSNAQQRELLHILSHDLTNPFSSIVSLSEVIEAEPFRCDEFLPRIKALSLNGLELIQLIRQMRALELKGLCLTPVNLKEAIDRGLAYLQDRASLKGIRFLVNDFSPHLYVNAEMTSLVNTVLGNLLTNAIKFSYADSEIRLTLEESGEWVYCLIEDQGVGMSAKLLSQVFDMTKKTSRIGTAEEPGTGFGMPLVQRFMLHYGGTIDLQSWDGEDHGTQVKLTFKRVDVDLN